jgi:hypothetical protein
MAQSFQGRVGQGQRSAKLRHHADPPLQPRSRKRRVRTGGHTGLSNTQQKSMCAEPQNKRYYMQYMFPAGPPDSSGTKAGLHAGTRGSEAWPEGSDAEGRPRDEAGGGKWQASADYGCKDRPRV